MGGAAFVGVASRAEVGTGSRRRGATEGFRLSSVPEQKKYTLYNKMLFRGKRDNK